jgi:serine/threonine protein kinase
MPAQRFQPSPGEKVAGIQGRYVLEKKLSRGGQAQIWQALVDGETSDRVAIKFMLDDGSFKKTNLAREIELLSDHRLRHANIVRYVDHNSGEGDRPLMLVLELAVQTFFDCWKDRGQVFGWPEFAPIFLGLLDALTHLHAHDIVHRDVTLENILLEGNSANWRPKLVDFGIAYDKTRPAITIDRKDVGKLGYAPPTGWGDNATPTPYHDVYSLGVVAYLALTAKHLPDTFQGPDTDFTTDVRDANALHHPAQPVPDYVLAWLAAMLNYRLPAATRPTAEQILEGIRTEQRPLPACLPAPEPFPSQSPAVSDELADKLTDAAQGETPSTTDSVIAPEPAHFSITDITQFVEEQPAATSGWRSHAWRLAGVSVVIIVTLALLSLLLWRWLGLQLPLPIDDHPRPILPVPIVTDKLPKLVAAGQTVEVQVKAPGPLEVPHVCVVEPKGKLRITGTGNLKFAPDTGIRCAGRLEIIGADKDRRLVFERLDPKHPWCGVLVEGSGASESSIIHAVFRGASGFPGWYPDAT